MLPERSALSCFSFTAQFQVPAYSLTFSAYEFPPERSPIYRNVPPFSSLTPRTIVGSHQTSEGNVVDLALSHGAAWGEEKRRSAR
jgi:hypothetical protein